MVKKITYFLSIFFIINMVSCDAFSKGKLKVEVNFPPELIVSPEVVMTITPVTEGQEVISATLTITGTQAIYENNEIPVGDYSIAITLQDGSLIFWVLTDTFKVDPMTKTLVTFNVSEDKFTSKPLYPPVFSVTHNNGTSFPTTLTTPSVGASIYYTLDPTLPDAENPQNGTLYSSSVSFNLNDIAHAVSSKEGWITSEATTFNFIRPTDIPVITNNTTDPFASYLEYEFTKTDAELTIYYTLDGSFPQPATATSIANNGTIDISEGNITVTAVTHKSDYLTSNSASTTSRKMATPTFADLTETGTPGEYQITINSTDADAIIYYRNDGTSPSLVSDTNVTPGTTITFNGSNNLIAIATKAGAIKSSDATFYSVLGETPIISDARFSLKDALEIEITATGSDSIYYTENGNDPVKDVEGTLYATIFAPTPGTGTIKAKAYFSDYLPSAIASQIIETLVAPTIELGLLNQLTITHADATHIYFTTDTTDPSGASSTLYSAGVQIPHAATATTTVRALAAKEFAFSNTNQLDIGTKTTTPVLSDNRGVNILDTLEILITPQGGTTTYYTLDGSNPFTNSARLTYAAPVTVSPTQTLKAISTVIDELTSDEASADGTALAEPTMTLNANLTDDNIITIDGPVGSSLFYTTGVAPADPTIGDTYAAPFAISPGDTVKAAAGQTDFNPSFAQQTFSAQATAPTFTDERSASTEALSIGITTTESGGTSYYTTNNTDPVAAGIEYAGAFAPGATDPVRAITRLIGKFYSTEASLTIAQNTAPVVTLGKLNEVTITPEAGKEIYYADNADPLTGTLAGATLILDLVATINLRTIKVDPLQTGSISAINHPSAETALNVVAQSSTPVLSDGRGGNYFDQLAVSSSVVGAEESYYTLDATTPREAGTAGSTLVAGNVTVPFDDGLNFQNTEDGVLVSEVATIDGTRLTTPVITLNADSEFEIASADGGSIYYTTDGSDPTFAGIGTTTTLYAGAVAIAAPTTIKAIAVDELKNPSLVAEELFDEQATSPTFTDERAASTDALSIGITTNEVGGTSYYTIDDTDPIAAGIEYLAPFNPGLAPDPVRAISKLAGKLISTEASLTIGQNTAPVVALGKLNEVTITPEAGKEIYYADNADPLAGTLAGTTLLLDLVATINLRTIKVDPLQTGSISAINHPSAETALNVVAQSSTPVLSDGRGGNYFDQLAVSASVVGAEESYYTLDATTPREAGTAGSTLVAGNVTVPFDDGLNFQNTEEGVLVSEVAAIDGTRLTSPVISLNADDEVEITSPDGGSIYYTTDGSDPTFAGIGTTTTLYAGAIAIVNPTTVKAIVVDELKNPSEITTQTYDTQAADPVFVDGRSGDLQFDLVIEITKGDATDSTYYTTNAPASTPTSADTEYDGTPIATAGIDLIRAKSYSDTSFNSGVAELDISTPLTDPVISVNGDELIVITADPADTIYYTIDGTSPINNNSALVYSAPFAVTAGTFIKAIATRELYKNSAEVQAQAERTPQPVILDNRVDYRTALEIQFSLAGATIYYTLDGTEPSEASSSTTSGTLIDASAATEIRAFATKPGFLRSETVTQEVVQLVAPTLTLNVDDTITIESSDAGATFHYTDDASDPMVSGTTVTYAAPFLITNPTQVRSVASAEFSHVSPETDTTFDQQTDAPTISPEGATIYNQEKSITISAPVSAPAANLYYSIDGGATWTEYTAPITVSVSGTTVLAKAQTPGEFASTAASETYTIKVRQPYTVSIIDNGDGTYTVQLAVDTAGATIYYIIDDVVQPITEGGAGETEYAGGDIIVPSGKTISFRAFKTDWTPSDQTNATMN
ncbi:MAG: chitobiase/beta-hexosaminidase C-terminal domain-containing protein [Spirochaetales bacterium]|nr:chitobiase/beta-hexosaminidase C-terminal domain-containing protein [Spirochaetales bacterium]